MASFSKKSGKMIVESVIPLTDNQLKLVQSNLGLEDSSIEVENRSTPNLIGGMRVSYMGKLLDLSLQSRINKLKVSIDESKEVNK